MKRSLYDYCRSQGNSALLQQWDVERNGTQTPESLTFGSHQKVWWRCEKGHQWQAAVKSRVSGTGCPYCANRVLSPGENDLASTHPDLLRQWDTEGNGTLRPVDLFAGSHKKVWWRCEKGHRWQAMVTTRARGAGCPVCAGKVVVAGENDLASAYPAVAREWDHARNTPLTPETCPPSSNRRVWWRCSLGHSYQAAVGARTVNGSDCPYCTGRKVLAGFNDLATLEPETARDWHPTQNAPLTPEMVTPGSRRKVWWQCPEGHTWKAVVYSRTGPKKCGCPVCAGTVSQTRRRYAKRQITAPAVFEKTF
ncbi:MAG: zinc-ribbon domain-containing protein [Ruminiclostridium sp.]|nr:zinc-ribbon domain-containing protein [Ruminiclostridium sp.]